VIQWTLSTCRESRPRNNIRNADADADADADAPNAENWNLSFYDRLRHIPDVHRNRMQPGEKWKADFGFRRNRPFATDARNLEAVIQRRKSVFPFVGRQSSGRSR